MLRYSSVLRNQSWVTYYVKDNETGPVIWEVKEYGIYIRAESGGVALAKRLRLIVARNILNKKEEEIKYFVSNVPSDVLVSTLLLVGFNRWHVERLFGDTKQKTGLGDFECRHYAGLIRHLLLCTLPIFFCKQYCLNIQKKRKFDDLSGLPNRTGHTHAKIKFHNDIKN